MKKNKENTEDTKNRENTKKTVKILLVEDNLMVMKVNKMLLNDLGYEPDTAETGNQAVEMAANNYDLIFMDIGLPDIDGIQATAKIRQAEKATKKKKLTPIIELTAYSREEVLEKCLAVGMNDVLNKPANCEELRLTIEKFCD